jgi:protein-L-isoaspartate(D-aspartate) O-methyltransferase
MVERQPASHANGGGDPPEAQALRQALVSQIAEYPPWPVGSTWDPRVLYAMAEVPRHLFVPGASLADAYRDDPYPIGRDQTISQPTVVALMTQALQLTGQERVLEIGTGSGYQAAVLALLARSVFTVERLASLAESARAHLAMMGARNVHVRVGDGYEGWPANAPFDRIVITAAPSGVPQTLLDQLAEGGILVAPVGDLFSQTLVRWRKREGEVISEDLGPVRFVPMLPGTA